MNFLLLIAFYILWCSLALLNCFLSLDVGPCAKLPDPFIPPYSARSVSWGGGGGGAPSPVCSLSLQ